MNIEELEALREKATPGKWMRDGVDVKDDPFNRVRYAVVTRGKTIARIAYSSYEGGPTNAAEDATYIAALHNAAPELFAAKRRLDALEEAMERFPSCNATELSIHADQIEKERSNG